MAKLIAISGIVFTLLILIGIFWERRKREERAVSSFCNCPRMDTAGNCPEHPMGVMGFQRYLPNAIDPKSPQTHAEWFAQFEGSAHSNPLHRDADITLKAWNAAQAALRADMEQEKAEAVAVAKVEGAEAACKEIRLSITEFLGFHLPTGCSTFDAIVYACNQARSEAVREGERREAVAEAREKALRERLEGLLDTWEILFETELVGGMQLRACTNQLRAILK